MISLFKEKIREYKRIKDRKRAIKLNTDHKHVLKLSEIIKQYLSSKIKITRKESAIDENMQIMPSGKVNHIAIVLDGKVEDVIRAQNQMTALLLNGPTFVVFDPNEVYPTLGLTNYIDGKFFNPGQDHARPPESNVQNHDHDHSHEEEHVHDESCDPNFVEINEETKKVLNEAI
jgi:hypothetical protein